ncbi:hypothetical protein C8R43DRAFT_988344 [Mycena crocata]|nr:hypothetical protein C8R43DRAFT_988344 [Mycena crocata]
MIFGPMAVYFFAGCLWTMLTALLGIPCTVKTLIHLSSNQLRHWAVTGVIRITILYIYCLFCFSFMQYRMLHPDIQQLLWDAITSHQSRNAIRIVYQFLLWDYRDWKAEQIDDFHTLLSELPKLFWVCWETWGTLCFVQRLLIVGPAVIFHGYFYIIPITRRLLRAIIRKFRRR